jgi:transposase
VLGGSPFYQYGSGSSNASPHGHLPLAFSRSAICIQTGQQAQVVNRPDRIGRPGQPESSYKLDLRVRAKICESILEGLTLDAAALAGVSRQTVNEWRRRGEEKPDSLYGEFSEAFELAKLQSKKDMIQKLLRHKDPRWTWKLMCNRWPEEFRDRVATEVSGPNGVPLMPQNPFKVEIRLADSEEIQTDFEVEEPDGSISHVHYDPYGLERQREARKQQKDATS